MDEEVIQALRSTTTVTITVKDLMGTTEVAITKQETQVQKAETHRVPAHGKLRSIKVTRTLTIRHATVPVGRLDRLLIKAIDTTTLEGTITGLRQAAVMRGRDHHQLQARAFLLRKTHAERCLFAAEDAPMFSTNLG